MGAEIRLAALRVSYGVQEVLRGVNLEVSAGSVIAVAGLSGCGKSTLLKAMCGQIDPAVSSSTGAVSLNGLAPEACRGAVEIALCFQRPFLFPWLDTRSNVNLARRLHPAEHPTDTADQVLKEFGLTDAAGKYPAELSGGMAQRVALAREFARRPDVLLLDEPFGSLDCVTREQLTDHLLAFSRKLGTTVVVVTHAPEEAVYVADRVVVLRDGVLVEPDRQLAQSGPRSPEWRFTPEFRSAVEWIVTALKESASSRR